ncbi:hypothetical protein [Marinomonas sp. TW1]|nr:hypothetical protein [Marinomonas sp. TW1]
MIFARYADVSIGKKLSLSHNSLSDSPLEEKQLNAENGCVM